MIITSPGSGDKILACQYLNKGVQVDLLLHTGRLVDIEAISHKLGPHVCEEFVCGTGYDAMSVHGKKVCLFLLWKRQKSCQ